MGRNPAPRIGFKVAMRKHKAILWTVVLALAGAMAHGIRLTAFEHCSAERFVHWATALLLAGKNNHGVNVDDAGRIVLVFLEQPGEFVDSFPFSTHSADRQMWTKAAIFRAEAELGERRF